MHGSLKPASTVIVMQPQHSKFDVIKCTSGPLELPVTVSAVCTSFTLDLKFTHTASVVCTMGTSDL